MPKKICITGSRGFVGSALLPLLEKEYEVVAFTGDLLDKAQVVEFFSSNPDIEVVVNLAGRFTGDLQELLNINLITLANLLEEGVKHGVKKFVHTSTCAVYGEPQNNQSVETDKLVPNTPYGLAKKFAEELLQFYAGQNNFEYTILRFSSVYGGEKSKGVINSFASAIQEKGIITINGDGEQTRNFLHVSDACEALALAIEYPKSVIFNISNPESISINDLVALFKEKYTFEVEYKPANNNLRDVAFNIDKARSELKFEPKVTKVQL